MNGGHDAGETSIPKGSARTTQRGEELALYCRQRHPSGFLIGRRICVGTDPIRLNFAPQRIQLRGDVVLRRGAELDAFAVFDGFESFDEMAAFWRKTHQTDEFRGWHIRWLPLP